MPSTRVRALPRVAGVAVLVLVLLLSSGWTRAATPPAGDRLAPLAISATLTIRPDGTVSTAGILSQSGATYTLTTAYLGSIADERNGSTLNGAGKQLTYTSGTATVLVYDAVNVTVTGFRMLSTVTGVEVLNSSFVTVHNNTVSTRGQGIAVIGSTSVTVSNNTAPSTAGFGTSDSSRVTVEGNDFYHSTADGIAAFRIAALTLLSNDFSSAAADGIGVSYVSSLVLRENTFATAAGKTALSLDYVNGGNISSNNLTRTSSSVQIAYSTNLTLWKNEITPATTYPYNITLSAGIAVVDSVVRGAGFSGVSVDQDTGVTLLRDDFTNSGMGVNVEFSSGVQILDSRVGGGGYGVYCLFSYGLTITGSDLGVANTGLYAVHSSLIEVQRSNFARANVPVNLTGFTHDVVVRGSDLDGAQIGGVYLNNVSNATFDASTIRSAAQYAVDATLTTGLSISDSNLSGTSAHPGIHGIELGQDTDVEIVNDSLRWTQFPITDTGSNGVRVVGTDLSNATGGLDAISLHLDQNVVVEGSDLSHGAGQGIGGDHVINLDVGHSNFLGLQFNGLTLTACQGVSVTANVFDNEGGNAIYASTVNGLAASGNSLSNDSYAFFLSGGTDAVLAGNTALADRDGGLGASNLNGLVMTGNTFSDDSARDLITLNLLDVVGVSIMGNTLARDFEALYVSGFSQGTVIGNSFLSDNLTVDIAGTVVAQLYHNDFISDKGWILQNTPTLAWDDGYPSGGNYWSNYSGPDRASGPGQNLPGADGIGDQPMVLTPANVDHYPLMTAWADHAATFVETGLPVGTPWDVVFNGTAYRATSASITVVSTVGAQSPYAFSIPTVLAYAAFPSSGAGMLGAGRVSVAVAFAIPTYPLTFTESGLSAGAQWNLTVNGVVHLVTGGRLVLSVANGTYSYAVGSLPGFTSTPAHGSIAITGGPQTVALSFVRYSYALTVLESGLPSGTSWSVTVGGNTSSSTGPSLTVALANGSYVFKVGPVSGYDATPTGGSWTVSGGPVTAYLTFAAGSASPPSGKSSSGLSSPGLLGYYLAIGVLLVVAAAGWVLALRSKARSSRLDGTSPAAPGPPPPDKP